PRTWRVHACSLRPRHRTSPARSWPSTAAAAPNTASGRPARGDRVQRMRSPIEAPPQLSDRQMRRGMHDVGRQLGQRAEHVGALQQVRARQLQSRLIADEVAVQQYVEIDSAGSPARRVTLAAARLLDGVQLPEYRVQRQVSLEPGHEVDEVLALEADGTV